MLSLSEPAATATYTAATAAAAAAAKLDSRPEDVEDMRMFVADTMDTLLRRFHIDAKLKTGILGCEVWQQYSCGGGKCN
jgi:hypothetical protein